MSYFLTYSGIKFDVSNIEAQNIKIKDIAHSLSLLCRGNGHYKYFYSVAQHCINCFEEARSRKLSFKLQLASLMHDSSEAYLSDIISDIKELCPDYILQEKRLLDAIFEKYNLRLTEREWAIIYDIDKFILKCEFQKIQQMPIGDIGRKISKSLKFQSRNCKKIEITFIKIFNDLQKHI